MQSHRVSGIRYAAENFSLRQIADSGQCFRMEAAGADTFSVISGSRYLKVSQRGSDCFFYCGEQDFETFWKPYFDLDTDYTQWTDQIDPRDRYLTRAAERGRGIRILRQDPFEMIVTFLISQQNHIARIKRCIRNICRQYGARREAFDGTEYCAFPTAEALASADPASLSACNLGYRGKYVLAAARRAADGLLDPEALTRMEYGRAREQLLQLYGVGPKVADCICLFGLHQLEAFPVDTHIRQALEKHYPSGFPLERYQGFQGVLQQYLFYQELFPDPEI